MNKAEGVNKKKKKVKSKVYALKRHRDKTTSKKRQTTSSPLVRKASN
jgi:hypothetical protein